MSEPRDPVKARADARERNDVEARADARERNDLVERVERHRARRERHAREGERSLAQDLALAGTVGWLVVVPALLGIALGRYVDDALHTGITCTAALVFLGVACGSYLAYRRIRES